MNHKTLPVMLLTLFAILVMAPFALGINSPTSPDNITVVSSSSYNLSLYPTQSIQAEAGNVTQIDITAHTQTVNWQGYYGNINGTITLQDAQGFVFYDWFVAQPKGEIFATTNTTLDWLSIHCFNYSATTEANLTDYEQFYGIPDLKVDGINETFNETRHDAFYVGPVSVAADTCHSTWIYENSARQTLDYENVLLTDNSSLIFTTLIENRDPNNNTMKTGYNGQNMNFQMLVAEDGHNSTTSAITTTYYFFVELA